MEIRNVENDEVLWRVSLPVSRCQVTTGVPVKRLHIDSAFYSRILLNVCMPYSTGAVQLFCAHILE